MSSSSWRHHMLDMAGVRLAHLGAVGSSDDVQPIGELGQSLGHCWGHGRLLLGDVVLLVQQLRNVCASLLICLRLCQILGGGQSQAVQVPESHRHSIQPRQLQNIHGLATGLCGCLTTNQRCKVLSG